MARRAPGLGFLFLHGVLAGVVACDKPDDDDDDGSDTSGTAAGSVCENEMRDDTYTMGLAKEGGALRFSFVDANPAPPQRGNNTWTLRLDDLAGVPQSACSGTAVPFMPDHMHGTSIVAHVTEGDVPGEYVIDPVNLYMPQLWQVTLDFACPGDLKGEVVFAFCVEP